MAALIYLYTHSTVRKAPPSQFASERDDAASTAASLGGAERGSTKGMVRDMCVHMKGSQHFTL